MAEDENSKQQFQALLDQLQSLGQDEQNHSGAGASGVDRALHLQQLEKKREKILSMMSQLQSQGMGLSSKPAPPPPIPTSPKPPSGAAVVGGDIYQNISHLVKVGALPSSSPTPVAQGKQALHLPSRK